MGIYFYYAEIKFVWWYCIVVGYEECKLHLNFIQLHILDVLLEWWISCCLKKGNKKEDKYTYVKPQKRNNEVNMRKRLVKEKFNEVHVSQRQTLVFFSFMFFQAYSIKQKIKFSFWEGTGNNGAGQKKKLSKEKLIEKKYSTYS